MAILSEPAVSFSGSGQTATNFVNNEWRSDWGVSYPPGTPVNTTGLASFSVSGDLVVQINADPGEVEGSPVQVQLSAGGAVIWDLDPGIQTGNGNNWTTNQVELSAGLEGSAAWFDIAGGQDTPLNHEWDTAEAFGSGNTTIDTTIGSTFRIYIAANGQTSLWVGGSGDSHGDVFAQLQVTMELTYEATIPKLTFLSTKTFIATDTITLRASINRPQAGVQVLWTVEGKDAAENISGFPADFATTTDSNGISTFAFTPSSNPNLVNDRRTKWTKGSNNANPPLSFEVIAKTTIDGVHHEMRLSDTTLGSLSQDETDRLRQEYFDYKIPVPARSEVVSSVGQLNKGNYSVQLSVGLDNRFDAILAAYRGRRVKVLFNGRQYVATIPADAIITPSSAYRNPQRNRFVGSIHPDSRHTRGRALDLVPSPAKVTIVVKGLPRMVNLPLHRVLYPALHLAAMTQGKAIAEKSAIRVPVGDPRENHIHVQW